jgi:hypothetical protein
MSVRRAYPTEASSNDYVKSVPFVRRYDARAARSWSAWLHTRVFSPPPCSDTISPLRTDKPVCRNVEGISVGRIPAHSDVAAAGRRAARLTWLNWHSLRLTKWLAPRMPVTGEQVVPQPVTLTCRVMVSSIQLPGDAAVPKGVDQDW